MRFRAAWPGALGLVFMALALTSKRDRPAELDLPLREPGTGDAYAIEVGAKETVFDLPFDPSSRYLMIVGSLAPFGSTHEVVVSSEPCAAPLPLSAWRVEYEPFRSREVRVVEAGAAGEVRVAAVEPVPQTSKEQAAAKAASALRAVPAPPRVTARDSLTVPSGDTLDESSSRPPTRGFYVHVTDGDLSDPKQYVRVTAREVASGRTVRIFLDDKHPAEQLSRGLCDELIRLCDDEVVPAISLAVAPCRDVDGDGRFTILLTPWLNALQGGRTSLGGFVRATDFDSTLPEPLSNHGDILYLNATLTTGPHLRTLVAHEFMHAACISARLPNAEQPVGLPHEEDWISEGLAHLAENAWGNGWSNLDYRVAEYLDDPAKYPLVVPDYYRAGLWRCHGCRGATWLFLRWCADRAGPAFLEEMARTPVTGTAGLEGVTGRRFAELFRRWSLAVACSANGLRPNSPDDYTNVRLIGRLGTRTLSGPHVRAWDVDAGSQRLELASTAVSFVELGASGSAGARRIRVAAPPSARLQVTLLKVPRGGSSPSAPSQIVMQR